MAKHTATPWKVDYRGTLGHIKAVISPGMFTPTVCRFDKHLVAASLSEEERKANAAFICRACNSHEALCDALRNVLTRLDLEPVEAVFPCSAMRESIRQALKLAEEE